MRPHKFRKLDHAPASASTPARQAIHHSPDPMPPNKCRELDHTPTSVTTPTPQAPSSSPLLALPGELMNDIYDYLINTDGETVRAVRATCRRIKAEFESRLLRNTRRSMDDHTSGRTTDNWVGTEAPVIMHQPKTFTESLNLHIKIPIRIFEHCWPSEATETFLPLCRPFTSSITMELYSGKDVTDFAECYAAIAEAKLWVIDFFEHTEDENSVKRIRIQWGASFAPTVPPLRIDKKHQRYCKLEKIHKEPHLKNLTAVSYTRVNKKPEPLLTVMRRLLGVD